MKDIIKKSGYVSARVYTSDGNEFSLIGNSQSSVYLNITPVTATLMIQALQEYLDGLSVSQPVDYVKPIAE